MARSANTASRRKTSVTHVQVTHFGAGELEEAVGIQLREDRHGRLKVSHVNAGSVAEASGLAAGAVLIAIDGESVREMAAADVLLMLTSEGIPWMMGGEQRRSRAYSSRTLKFSMAKR